MHPLLGIASTVRSRSWPVIGSCGQSALSDRILYQSATPAVDEDFLSRSGKTAASHRPQIGITMFGYLPAPCRCQIGNQADLYRSTFCGLCNALAGQYGQPARLLVNRDSTFVALLAAAQSPVAPTVTLSTRCQPWSRPIPVFESGFAPAFAAAVTLCGLQAKLDDEQADERGLRAAGCRVLVGVVAQTFRPRTIRSGCQ